MNIEWKRPRPNIVQTSKRTLADVCAARCCNIYNLTPNRQPPWTECCSLVFFFVLFPFNSLILTLSRKHNVLRVPRPAPPRFVTAHAIVTHTCRGPPPPAQIGHLSRWTGVNPQSQNLENHDGIFCKFLEYVESQKVHCTECNQGFPAPRQ